MINMALLYLQGGLQLILRGEQMTKLKHDSMSPAARELGRRGGLATAARMSQEQLRARARKGGLARARAKKGVANA